MKCRITWARTVAMAGRGGRAAHGEAMHVMDRMQMQQWWRTSTAGARGNGDGGAAVVEPPNLMPHRSACLLLDTKHSRENTKLPDSVGHTLGENPKIHIFAIRITNERIKLASFVTISYITFNTSEYNIY